MECRAGGEQWGKQKLDSKTDKHTYGFRNGKTYGYSVGESVTYCNGKTDGYTYKVASADRIT